MHRDPHDDQDVFFEYFPYKTYEEIQQERRRRLKRRRGIFFGTLLFFFMAVGVVNIGIRLTGGPMNIFGATEPVVNTQVNSFAPTGEQRVSQHTTGQAGQAGSFELPLSAPEDRTEAIYVKDVSAIVRMARQSVVGITSEVYSTFSQQSSGSGIILSENGYIVTNNHVISGGESISVTLDGGETYPAVVIGTDVLSDLAVIKIEADQLPVASFGDSDLVEAGQAAIAIGNPTGQLQGSVTAGIVSAVNRNVSVSGTVMNLIQTDAAINSGNSGGPLLNQYGQVVGVNSVKLGVRYGYEGISFAIPINTVKPIVEQLVERGYISGRPLVGVSCVEISKMASAFYSLPQGLLIEGIAPDSGLIAHGVAAGDIIIYVDGQRVSTLSDACALRNQYAAGETLTLSVYRKGKQYDLSITLLEQTGGDAEGNF